MYCLFQIAVSLRYYKSNKNGVFLKGIVKQFSYITDRSQNTLNIIKVLEFLKCCQQFTRHGIIENAQYPLLGKLQKALQTRHA